MTEESQQQRLQGVAKHTRPPSIEACSSKKKTRREPAAEVLSQETSSLAIDPESVQAGLLDEDFGPFIFKMMLNKGSCGDHDGGRADGSQRKTDF